MRTDSELRQRIIETVAFFDLFDYPLTLVELQRFLWKYKIDTLGQLMNQVEHMADTTTKPVAPLLEYVNGLISLAEPNTSVTNRTSRGEYLRSLRAERYLESERKYRLRLRYIRWISYLPGVRAIFVVNSLANQNVQRASDIDLLIITRRGKIWSTRFFTTALAKLLGIRPQPERRQDSLCLSFYIDESALNMRALTQNGQYDMFEAYWLRQMMPIYDPYTLRDQIAQANQWINDVLPNGQVQQPHPDRSISYGIWHGCIKTLLGWLMIEPLWRWVQLTVLPDKLKKLSGHIDSAVVVLSPQLLKFHTLDPRVKWKQQWHTRVTDYSRYGPRNSTSFTEAATYMRTSSSSPVASRPVPKNT